MPGREVVTLHTVDAVQSVGFPTQHGEATEGEPYDARISRVGLVSEPITVTTVAEGVARLTWTGEPAMDEVRRVVAAALTEHPRVETLVPAHDQPGQRIATWSGMRREGVMRGVTAKGEPDDRIVYARLVIDAPIDEPGGFRALLNSFLPRKRAIGQMLIRDQAGRVLDQTKPAVWKTPISPQTAAIETQLMIGVAERGTASCCIALAGGIPVAAKTGTAELGVPSNPDLSHAWIIAFAPADDPQYAVSVVLTNVQSTADVAATGGRLAGPIAKGMLDFLLTGAGSQPVAPTPEAGG